MTSDLVLMLIIVFISAVVGGLLGGWLVIEAMTTVGNIEAAVRRVAREVYRGEE